MLALILYHCYRGGGEPHHVVVLVVSYISHVAVAPPLSMWLASIWARGLYSSVIAINFNQGAYMARQVFQLQDSAEQPTRYVGITDDGITLRVFIGHFFNGPFNTSYVTAEGDPMKPLWRGPVGDWSQEIIDWLDAGETLGETVTPIKKAPKVLRRARKAGA
jgi:hypothetical protein